MGNRYDGGAGEPVAQSLWWPIWSSHRDPADEVPDLSIAGGRRNDHPEDEKRQNVDPTGESATA
jgi:hypothetical protein